MNGSDLSSSKISKTSKPPGAPKNLSFLPESIKSYAGTFIPRMRFPMFYQAGLKRAKPETHIYVTYIGFCKDLGIHKSLTISGKHDLDRTGHSLSVSFNLLLKCSLHIVTS